MALGDTGPAVPPPLEKTMQEPLHYRTIAELGRALRADELSA